MYQRKKLHLITAFLKWIEVQGLKLENEQLEKQIVELTKQLQGQKTTAITVEGEELKSPCIVTTITESEPEMFNEHEDLDLARELYN